jgi:hypothetical protein
MHQFFRKTTFTGKLGAKKKKIYLSLLFFIPLQKHINWPLVYNEKKIHRGNNISPSPYYSNLHICEQVFFFLKKKICRLIIFYLLSQKSLTNCKVYLLQYL